MPPELSGNHQWRFAVDRGGTFTDVIGFDPHDNIHTAKLLSESPDYEDAAIEGIRQMLGAPREKILPEDRVAWIRFGTTVATNALLERKGASTGLIITQGFRDLLEIGTQERPDLFALAIKKPQLLYREVWEVPERMNADGVVVRPIDLDVLKSGFEKFQTLGIESVAIVFLHAWRNSEHERIAHELAREFKFSCVAVSHRTLSLIQAVGRGQTTLLDAYLGPVLEDYTHRLRRWTGSIPLSFMGSSGGLHAPSGFIGKDAVFSGPAGGVLAVEHIAQSSGDDALIGFDMGGTSTDVCRYDGVLDRVLDVNFAGIKFQAPILHINTVAAGGGSILGFDGGKLTVGPESAGAYPGPACYGRGGPAAITDANVILGRVVPHYTPSLFGNDRVSPLDIGAAQTRLRELQKTVTQSLSCPITEIELALGYIRVANEAMCRPIKALSVSRGYDVRDHVLICLGGAAGQHACGIARILGISHIRIHPLAGVLSAYGIAIAPVRRMSVEAMSCHADDYGLQRAHKRASEIASALEQAMRREHETPLSSLPTGARKIEVDVRSLGTDHAITIPWCDTAQALTKVFGTKHRQHFGFDPPADILELVNIRVEVSTYDDLLIPESRCEPNHHATPTLCETTRVWFEATQPCDVPVYQREALPAGFSLSGPALIVENHSTILVEPGFNVNVEPCGTLLLSCVNIAHESLASECDPVFLEVFHHRFMSIAEQMGDTLVRTSHSTNIKERRDFSCAVFDAEGQLVANAPHIPVHLGAMGETVRQIIRQARLGPGDVVASNDPYNGGSHLPDITLLSPVFRNDVPQFYVACRAHHADIGGVVPGSMPPYSTRLEDEGIVIKSLLLVRDHQFREADILSVLRAGAYPARNLPERLSDLRAQVGALRKGGDELRLLCDHFRDDVVTAYMRHIRNHAANITREALNILLADRTENVCHFSDVMDDGTVLRARIRMFSDPASGVQAEVDFSGTSAQVSGNLNAPPAVTRAAVLYVFRTLFQKPIPLNDGCLEPIRIKIPDGNLLKPNANAAVAGGNVETSQRIVDVLYGALDIAAASQGTMNNVLFGSPDGTGAQYYETIAGGAGAVNGAHGASAVQVHMTNTRMTDVEVLEQRFPAVRIERFEIRRGSGGNGAWRGGDGVIRSYRFLQPQALTVLSERRTRGPFGLRGGKPGAPGQNLLMRSNGRIENLGSKAHVLVAPGDRLEIRTPGGGGFRALV